MAGIFLESWARCLVVLHAATAIGLIGASTHQVLIARGELRGDRRPRLRKIYAATTGACYLATFALGAIVYPTFRYHTRALYLDRYAPWASNLFDLKENLATIGLPVALGAFILSRLTDEPDLRRAILPAYVGMVVCTAAIVWFDVIAGLVIALERGV